MKDLGRLKYFLGIEVIRSKQGIFMYQKKYVLDLLAEIGMVDCKPMDTPMIVNQKLYMEKKARLDDKGRYQRMVGKLIYLSHTRTDIAHAVGVVNWVGDKGDRKRQPQFYLTYWSVEPCYVAKQETEMVALSSAEAEFRGIARG
ncbi:putative reverse transcriptase, RNA-dependent DNA polymerase [Tanacetum coccineum]